MDLRVLRLEEEMAETHDHSKHSDEKSIIFVLRNFADQIKNVGTSLSELRKDLDGKLKEIQDKLNAYETSIQFNSLQINSSNQKVAVLESKVNDIEYKLMATKFGLEEIKEIKASFAEMANKVGHVTSKNDKNTVIMTIWDKLFWLVLTAIIPAVFILFGIRTR